LGGKMNKRLIFVSFLLAILTLLPVYGVLTVSSEIIENSIYLDEQARFSITITNPDSVEKIIQVYSTDIQWYSEVEPSIIKIGPGNTLKVELRLMPNVWTETGPQEANVYMSSSNSNDKMSMQFPVYVKSYYTEKKEYNPSVEMKITFPEEIDPRKETPVNIYLRNRNKLDIKEMELMVYSKAFSDYRIVSLEPYPNGERTETILLKTDPLAYPTEDLLEVSIRIKNRTINRERANYRIISYYTFATKEDSVEELFKKTTEYTIVNEGNIQTRDAFRVPTSLIRRIFTSTNPHAEKVNLIKEGYFEWNFFLRPMEETRVTVVENYRPMIYLILIAIVVAMVYFLYRSPLTIKKDSFVIGSSRDGISEMKVMLHIRNRTQDLIEQIKVTDLIPSIAELVKEGTIGTLAPEKIIKNDRKGTIVKWELEALEPFEERIISYRLNSKITIVGGVTLPPAKVKFETKKGKERTIRSNSSLISLGL